MVPVLLSTLEMGKEYTTHASEASEEERA